MTAARTTSATASLPLLANLYVWEDDLVRRLLVQHPETHDPLIHAAGLIPRYVGQGVRLSLSLDHDLDGSEPPELAATIHTSISPTEPLASLDQFDEDWWLDAMVGVHRHLSFGLRFA